MKVINCFQIMLSGYQHITAGYSHSGGFFTHCHNSAAPMKSVCTFGLDLFTVGGNNDTLNLVQLHVLGDLSETHDQAALGFGLVGILLVHSLLEANQLLQQESHALVDFLAEHLVTVPGEKQNKNKQNKANAEETGQSWKITSHSLHFKDFCKQHKNANATDHWICK